MRRADIKYFLLKVFPKGLVWLNGRDVYITVHMSYKKKLLDVRIDKVYPSREKAEHRRDYLYKSVGKDDYVCIISKKISEDFHNLELDL